MGFEITSHKTGLHSEFDLYRDRAVGVFSSSVGLRQGFLVYALLLGVVIFWAEGVNSAQSGYVQGEGIKWWSAGVAVFQAGVAARDDAAKARQQFAQAAAYWEKLWWEGEQTPVLARNRARAYYLAGNLPQALVAIHQGLALAPWDRHLQREEAALRAEVVKACDPQLHPVCQPVLFGWLRRWCSPWDVWCFVTVLWWGGWLALARFRMIRRWRWGVIAGGSLGGAVLLAVVWEWEQWQWQRKESHHPLLVLAQPSLLRMGNAIEYPPYWSAPLPAGVEGRWVGQRGGWVQLQLSDGTRGWVPASDVLWVQPMRQTQTAVFPSPSPAKEPQVTQPLPEPLR